MSSIQEWGDEKVIYSGSVQEAHNISEIIIALSTALVWLYIL